MTHWLPRQYPIPPDSHISGSEVNGSDSKLKRLSAFETDAGSIDDRLAHGLGRVAMGARHKLFRDATPSGLSVVQAQLLTALLQSGPIRVGDAAARLGLSAAMVSESASALERRKLLRRQRDGRNVLLELTAKGRRLAEPLSGWPDFLAACVGELGTEEKRALLRAVLAVVRRLQREGVVQDARMCPSCVYFRPHSHPGSERPHHCALVDLPFGDEALRIDCPDHLAEREVHADARWRLFLGGGKR